MFKPDITIAIPVYNGDAFLHQAIESILEQTYKHFCLLLLDNHSNDKTEEICRHYETIDSRITYYRNDFNVGASANFNNAFFLSKTKYFKWAAHDDYLGREFLERCRDLLESNSNATLVFSKVFQINSQNIYIDNYNPEYNIYHSLPQHRYDVIINKNVSCVEIFGLIRSSALKQTGLIKPYVGSDKALLLKISQIGPILEVPDFLFFHRLHSGRSVAQFKDRHARTEWFNPSLNIHLSFPHWKLITDFLLHIDRTCNTTFKYKTECLFNLITFIYINRSYLLWDLSKASQHILSFFPVY